MEKVKYEGVEKSLIGDTDAWGHQKVEYLDNEGNKIILIDWSEHSGGSFSKIYKGIFK